MRQRKSGTIINISSSGTYETFAACGLYSASKSALEALTEALARETGHFGIRSIIIVLGAFRTSALAPGNMVKPAAPYTTAYDETPVKAFTDMLAAASVNPDMAPGDPEKGAAMIFEIVHGTGMGTELREKGTDGQALRIVLGSDAFGALQRQIEKLKIVEEYGRGAAESTDA